MKRKLLLIVASLLLSGAMFAQESHWTGFDYHVFQKHMNIIGKAYFDGVVQDNPKIEIATFVNGELRGTKFLVEPYQNALPNQYFIWNACYFDNEGETLTFKAYDHDNGIEYDLCDTQLIGQQDGYGTMDDPIQMHFTRQSFGPEYSTWIPSTSYSGEGMTVVAQIRIDGQLVDRATYQVGAFCGDECRATSGTSLVDWTDYNFGYFAYMNVHGNDDDIINFYLYDLSSQSLAACKCYTTLKLINGDEVGVDIPGGNIFVLNFVTEHTFTKSIAGYSGGKDRYYLIATPVGELNPEMVTNLLSNSYDLYYFDQEGDADGREWINYKTNTFELVPGKGYLYANNTDVTLTFSGFPYLGDSVVTLTKDNNIDLPGWNLVGNPFAQTAYINKNCYVMNGTGTELQGAVAGTAIQAMEGIFVIADNDNEDLTFSTQAPLSKGSNLVINLTQGDRGATIDRAVVGFGDTDALPKFMLNTNHTKLYIPQDGKDYAIVSLGRDAAGQVSTIPVNFKVLKNGEYTITVNTENVDFSYLHLIDNKTGKDVDLLVTPSYSFEARRPDNASRFKLVFEAR